MGKGDKKSKKGKRFRKSHGKIRPKHRNIVRRTVLAIENMTKWSIERLYHDCGRYNRTTSIVFKDKSQSQTLFGQSITGEIFYTLEERRKLENREKNGFVEESNGNVKFKIILKDALNPTQIKILMTKSVFGNFKMGAGPIFGVTKLRRHDKKVHRTYRLPMGCNIAIFQSQTQAQA
jgi:ribosomal small subunit protein bTHX